jgi:hypothetical protein
MIKSYIQMVLERSVHNAMSLRSYPCKVPRSKLHFSPIHVVYNPVARILLAALAIALLIAVTHLHLHSLIEMFWHEFHRQPRVACIPCLCRSG